MSQLEPYISCSEDDSDFESHENTKSQNKIHKNWIKLATYETAREAESSIESIWSKYYTNYGNDGKRVHFRCNKVKRKGPQCSAMIHLLYHCDSDKVTLFKTENEHDRCLTANKNRGIDGDVKQMIDSLYNDGIKKPKQILRALQSKTTNLPTSSQLKNYLILLKRELVHRKLEYSSN